MFHRDPIGEATQSSAHNRLNDAVHSSETYGGRCMVEHSRSVDMLQATRALRLLLLRLGSVFAVSVLMWLALSAMFGDHTFPPTTMWATFGLLPVNLLCLFVVRRLYRAEGKTLSQAMGIQRGKVGRDVLWGLLWLVVMNIPFMLAVTGMVFVLYGADAPEAFATIFVDTSGGATFEPLALLIISIVAVVPFMLINAPTEELVFRGYGRIGLEKRWGPTSAIAVTSALFGAQHVFFAASVPGMLVYFVAFTVWGLVAALIVRRQGRLFPVIVAHYIVNILLSAPAIVFPILQLTGVIPGT